MNTSLVDRVVRGGEKVACFGRSHESRLAILVDVCKDAEREVVVVTRGREEPYGRAIELQRQLDEKRVQCVDELDDEFTIGTVTVISSCTLRREMMVQRHRQRIDSSLVARSLVVFDEDAALDAGGADCAFLTSPTLILYTTPQENAVELSFKHEIWALPLAGEAMLNVSSSEENWLRFKALSKRARSSSVEEDRRRDALRCAKELAGGEDCCTVVCSSRGECVVLARMAISEPTRWRSVCDENREEEVLRLRAIEALFLDDEETKRYARRGVALYHAGVRNRVLIEIAIDERLVGLVISDVGPRHGRAVLMKRTKALAPPAPSSRLVAVVDADEEPEDEEPAALITTHLGLWAWLRAAASGADERRAKALVEKLCSGSTFSSSLPARGKRKVVEEDADERRSLDRRRCVLLLRIERAHASGPWLQRGRLCLYEKKWVVVLERKDAMTVDVLVGTSTERDVDVRKLRLSAMRVFVPSRGGKEAYDGVSRSVGQALDDMKQRKSVMLDEMDVIPVTSDFGLLLQERLGTLEDAQDIGDDDLAKVESRLRSLLPDTKKYRGGLKCLERLDFVKKMKPTDFGNAALLVLAAFPDELRALVLFQAVFRPAMPHAGDSLVAAIVLPVVGRGLASSSSDEAMPTHVANAARSVYRATARHQSFLAEDDFVQSFADAPLLDAVKAWMSNEATLSTTTTTTTVGDDGETTVYESELVAALRDIARILPVLSDAARSLDRGDLVDGLSAARAALVKGQPFQRRRYLGVSRSER